MSVGVWKVERCQLAVSDDPSPGRSPLWMEPEVVMAPSGAPAPSVPLTFSLVMTNYITILWFWNILSYQYIHYYLVCRYLDIKIKNSNENLILIRKQKNSMKIKIDEILQIYNAIYCEIKEYDSTYLSKFLLTVWLLIGTLLVILIYGHLHIELDF